MIESTLRRDLLGLCMAAPPSPETATLARKLRGGDRATLDRDMRAAALKLGITLLPA